MPRNAIEVNGLTVRRGGKRVLDGLDFVVPAGTITGLLGPSGCGKTTLMRAVVGVQIVCGGEVTVLGEPAGSAVLRRKIGYATQNPAVYADLTVAEAAKYFAAVLGAPSADVPRVINEVGLDEQADQLIGSLSGGQRSRANLAVALLGKPELLVLDEPTVGLDPVLREELWALFRRLADRGATVLVSSHVMDEAGRCDRLLLMRAGDLLADRTPDELRADSGENDLEKAFLLLVRGKEPIR
jgi:ABC-2 type transport system ATP-binding protein